VAQAQLAGQQDIANNATLAGLNTSNFQNAESEFNTQQNTNLSAAQNTAARQLAASQQIGNLGNTAQTEALNEANAQTNAGTLQQTTQQAQDTAAYNQFLQQQAYPFQTTGWLANIVEGIGSQSGGTTTGEQTQTGGNGLSQIAGGLLGLASFLNRGGRVNDIRVPRKALGGALTSPYAGAIDPATGQSVGLGGGSWVPTSSLQIGHTMPTGQQPGMSGQPAQPGMGDVGKAVQGLGNSFENSSLGDSFNDAIQDMGDFFSKGGSVRPKFDDGGDVSPDALWVDANNPHGTGPVLQPNDITPLAAPAVAPPPVAGSSADVTPPIPDADIAKLRAAMSGANTGLADPRAVYGTIDPAATDSAVPVPPVRPAGLGIVPDSGPTAAAADGTPVPTDAGGNAISPATGAPTPGGLVPPVNGGLSSHRNAVASASPWTAPAYTGPAPKGPVPDPANYPTTQQGQAAFIRDYSAYAGGGKGLNTNFALGVAHAEGLNGAARGPNLASTVDVDKNGNPFSFGAFQLNVRNGLGNLARANGIDPADPAQANAANKFAMDYMASHGIQPWRGDQAVMAYQGAQGLGAAPAAQAIAESAAPATGLASAASDVGTQLVGDAKGVVSNLPSLGGPANANSPPGQNSGLFGLNFDPATRQGMLAAGLGMLGGTSKSAFANIGQGGLQGLNAYNNARKLQAGIGLQGAQAAKVAAETQGVGYENQLKAQGVKSMFDALHAQEALAAKRANSVATSTSQPGITARTITAPGVVNGSPAPGNAAPSGSALNPMADPAMLLAKINAEKWTNPQAAHADEGLYHEIISSGRSTDANGNIVNAPGAVSAAAELEANKAGASEAAKSHYDLVDVQPTPGGPTYKVPKSQLLTGPGAGSPPGSTLDAAAAVNPNISKQPEFYADKQKSIAADEQQMVSQYRVRQLSAQRLQALSKIMQSYQTGTFAEQKAGLVASLRGLGMNVPATATSDPAAFQEFTKNAMANVFNDLKTQGGHTLVSEVQGLMKANANAEMQPAANAAIIGQALGVINYENQHTKDYFVWKQQHPNAVNTSDFELPWADKHPVSQFVGAATKGLAYKGQDIPSAAQRTTGQTYLTPKGPMTWVGNGWRPAAAQ